MFAALALALAIVAPKGVEAQVFLAASAGASGFSGDDWTNVKSGFAAQGAVGTRIGSNFSLAGLFGWSRHGVDGPALPCIGCQQPSEENLNAITVELQPAVRFGSETSNLGFFVGARGGYASVGADEKATGSVIGGVAGASYGLSDRASLGVAGSYSALNLSNDALTDNLKGGKWGVGLYVLIGLGG